ncbi:hypothetical protein KBX37_24465 [Micromonospora sp. U56]|uniref:hypothetical protein n=1 Tax=Micromonospora sp. U56 TaxID=2824900 RepID=UPI001B38636B|nr:hypothetical protein [Micromonospora sp. U56]MBQ0896209.1 hypothetical protein [Micromonospora sp. U56]
MTGDASDYSGVKLTVLEFDDAVRKRPGMYFGAAREDPGLATQVLCTVLRHALHPAAKVAPDHTPHVIAEISADLAFSATDDQADALSDQGTPWNGYYGSLLTNNRWAHAAAAVLSSQTTVEIWRNGRGFRQQLNGLRPVEPPAEFSAPAGSGTRVTYILDTGYFDSAAAITTDLAHLDVHSLYCTYPAAPGNVIIRDLRDPHRLAEYRCD